MAFAPFREFLALIILDGDFDLPQHQLAGLADGRSKGGDGLRGVEIKDIQKILMLEVISRLHPAAKKTVQHKESSIREERIKQKNLFVFVPKVSFIPVYTSIFIPRYSYPDLILLFSNLSSYNHAL